MDCVSMGGVVESTDLLESYKDAPWPDKNIVEETNEYIVYKDGYPVTEGHLLFVPKDNNELNIVSCFVAANNQGNIGVKNGDYEGFNVGINRGAAAGQTVMWPHVHLIPRRTGDVEDPRGGVRHVIPRKGNYRI